MFRFRPGLFGGIVAVLALVVAMSGGAYAAGKITGKQIAKNAISSKHLKDGQVTAADLSADAKAAAAGPAGPRGAAGAPGAPGISGYEIVTGTSAESTGAGDWVDLVVNCPPGKKVLTHGATWTKLDPSDVKGVSVYYNSIAQARLAADGGSVTFYGYAESMPDGWGMIGQLACGFVA
ncbi:hypothetical protein [Nocardioides sp. L-11A]|uniref:hypothetical protein n=1 Tax=Nocardioides sp. L-11A TaxID=3043848 RepID=UPI00249C862B|nr:hypothetical protein QJ852_13115 [Nocardioides sp. L-11A]